MRVLPNLPQNNRRSEDQPFERALEGSKSRKSENISVSREIS